MNALQIATEALEAIALAGMSGSGQESEEGLRDWHARRAWEFMSTAARALNEVRNAGFAAASAKAVTTGVALAASRARRAYIAGPMTGLPEFNFPAFLAKAAELRAKGWHIESPAEHGVVEGATWADYLHYDISRITTCEAIFLLPGWAQSKGARLEVHIAQALGLTIHLSEGAEPVGPADPMDWPLPCDVTVGHGTMRKGVALWALVARMKVLYEMATGNDADVVASRTPEERQKLATAFLEALGTPEADDTPLETGEGDAR